MTRRAQALAAITSALVAVTSSATVAASSPDRSETVTYTGSFAGMDARVTLEVQRRPGYADRVAFEARGVKVACDDGRVRRLNVTTKPLKVDDGRFADLEYFSGLDFGVESYTRISGRFMRAGRARGTLFHNTDPRSVAGNRECTTDTGIARWRAEATR